MNARTVNWRGSGDDLARNLPKLSVLICACVLLFSASRADAGASCWGAGSVDLMPSATTSAAPLHADGSTWQYWVTDFGSSVDASIILPLPFWPSDDPTTMTAVVWWKSKTGVATDTIVWTVALGCADDGETLNGIVFGTAVSVSDAGKADATFANSTSATAAITPGGTCVANGPAAMQVARDVDPTDNLAAVGQLYGVCLSW